MPKVTGTGGDWSLRPLPSGSLHTQDGDKVQRQTLVDRGAHFSSTLRCAFTRERAWGRWGPCLVPVPAQSTPAYPAGSGPGTTAAAPWNLRECQASAPPLRALSSPALQPQVWASQPPDLEEHPGGGRRKGKAQLSVVIPSEDAGSDNHPGARRKRSTK